MAYCHSTERALTATMPAINNKHGHHSWCPVVYFADGRIKRLAGGLTHGAAMTAAEKEAEAIGDIESFGAQLESVRLITARSLSDQNLICGQKS